MYEGFYVAIDKTNRSKGVASAICTTAKDIKDFYRDYAGHEIRLCDDEEMKKLMTRG